MHFNFHLSGDETPEQSRRIANAVLALGGLLTPAKSVGEITVDLKVDTSKAVEALDKLKAHPAAQWAEEDELTPDTGATEYLNGVMDRSEALLAEVPTVTPPVTPVPTTSAVAPSGLDAKGLPWDERIHSSSRAVNADGTWRYRKNVPDETKQAVEAELRGLVQHVPTIEVLTASGPVEVPLAPVVPLPPIPAVAPPVPVSTAQRSYSDVVNLIMANQATLNKPELYVAVLGMSLPEFAAACIAKPELATVAYEALDKLRAA